MNVLTRLPSRDEVTAELCTRSLSRFIGEAWPIVEPATSFVHGWHIDALCEHLEAVSAGELNRLIINVPPRTMKSLTVAVFWPSWEWFRRAHLRWLCASYSADLSMRDSVKCRRLIESQGGAGDGALFQRIGYQGVLGLLGEDWELTGDQNVKSKYETTETGFRLATSVGGLATGEGGDRIVIDDPLSAKQARSEAERNAANTWWDETMSTRFNNADAAAVIVMQRLHEEDLTGHLVAQGGWHHLCLPAEYEPSHPFVYPERVTLDSGHELPGDPRTEEGALLDPVRLPAERLAELLRNLGSYAYAGQMQQRPAPEEGGMFKRHWWRRYDDDEVPSFERLVASWDMRFSDSQSAASSYVVGQLWGTRGSNRYLLGQIRARLDFPQTLQAVGALNAWRAGVTATLVEKAANGEAVVSSLASRVPGLLALPPEGSKEARGAAVTPLIEAGDVFLPAGEYIAAPPGYEPTTVDDYIAELATFPNGAHDDQADATSQALNWIANAPGPQPIVDPISVTGPSAWR